MRENFVSETIKYRMENCKIYHEIWEFSFSNYSHVNVKDYSSHMRDSRHHVSFLAALLSGNGGKFFWQQLTLNSCKMFLFSTVNDCFHQKMIPMETKILKRNLWIWPKKLTLPLIKFYESHKNLWDLWEILESWICRRNFKCGENYY